uniref:Uncharacterized protein n=1 Tax=Fagus sylvatica TaxID=28930 RepID=A0A2N9J1C5_FAGSY
MDSYALGVSGDTMDLVPLTIEFVDEDVEGIGLAAAEQAKLIVEQLDFAAEHLDLVSLEELGPQSIEELDDKRANSEATDAAEPKSLENLAEKPPSVPSKGLPLLNEFREKHGDFTADLQFGIWCWRVYGGVTKKLMKAGFGMEFMLDHIHLLAYAMFSHKAREGL